MALTKHSLYRVVYFVTTPPPDGAPDFRVGRRKTVVADEVQEAIDRVTEHESPLSIEITEVVREAIEVWS